MSFYLFILFIIMATVMVLENIFKENEGILKIMKFFRLIFGVFLVLFFNLGMNYSFTLTNNNLIIVYLIIALKIGAAVIFHIKKYTKIKWVMLIIILTDIFYIIIISIYGIKALK